MDASVLTALFIRESRSADARALARRPEPLIVSDFAALEVSSGVSRKVRMAELTTAEGEAALAGFDRWAARSTDGILVSEDDVAAADALVRRFELKLRAGDALHVAVARRLGAVLATFDTALARGARSAGLDVEA